MESKQLKFDFMQEKLPLEKAIQEYFDSHIYHGFCQAFKLDRILKSPISEFTCIKLKGDYEEMIEHEDEKWEEGLAKLGQNYGISLNLSYAMYRK
jgi:hypothetical protein